MKAEQIILDEAGRAKTAGKGRTLLVVAEEYAEPLCKYLEKSKGVKKVVWQEAIAAARRPCETWISW